MKLKRAPPARPPALWLVFLLTQRQCTYNVLLHARSWAATGFGGTMPGWKGVNRSVLALQGWQCRFKPVIGIVTGSGSTGVHEVVRNAGKVPFADVDGFPVPTVSGHTGDLHFGTIVDTPVVMAVGRVHLYEGYTPTEVVHCVRTMVQLGCHTVILMNAAGGISCLFKVGDFMVISDHLNLTGQNPLVGLNDGPDGPSSPMGPRFVDMTSAYDPTVQLALKRGLQRAAVGVHTGVYAGMLGPCYETPAEVRMLESAGAEAVGMSTVLEAIAARHLGARVGGISIISNAAAGLTTGTTLEHHEVMQAVERVTPQLIAGLEFAVPELAKLT